MIEFLFMTLFGIEVSKFTLFLDIILFIKWCSLWDERGRKWFGNDGIDCSTGQSKGCEFLEGFNVRDISRQYSTTIRHNEEMKARWREYNDSPYIRLQNSESVSFVDCTNIT